MPQSGGGSFVVIKEVRGKPQHIPYKHPASTLGMTNLYMSWLIRQMKDVLAAVKPHEKIKTCRLKFRMVSWRTIR